MSAGRQKWFQSAVLTAVAILLFAASIGVNIFKQRSQAQYIHEKIKALKPELVKADDIIKVVEFADENINHRTMVADLIAQLYRLTPEDIAFRSLIMDEQGGITIQGLSQARGSVNSLQNQLVNSAAFKNVTLQYASR